ncbi:Tyrosinase ustQ [Fulvia fulva]|uniref:Tyrosinase ustQ n=1 Tax=Passalora fulva TaxID=5499 RepID=A0A9Q8UWS5_PASFU|nr:Tyrosinase ustQ [Fulvia fulva]KAK4610025.1 Tyrosinase ustQ [Fulvia fulva]UJO25359.1 Tyrosinase ustQ [Fulvia fulva]WPV22476.1 Tyrosinase ustQ [Fulvia fulva]
MALRLQRAKHRQYFLISTTSHIDTEEDAEHGNSDPPASEHLAIDWQKLVLIFLALTAITFTLSRRLLLLPEQSVRVSTACVETAIRQEWRALIPTERDDFVRSVNCLSNTPSRWTHNGSVSDDFAYLHASIGSWSVERHLTSLIGHRSAAFLPWHRWTLHQWEKMMRQYCGFSGHVPYWDWTLDWIDLANSSIWDPDSGFGSNGIRGGRASVGNGTCVEDGPFADLRPIMYNHTYITHCLSRGFTNNGTSGGIAGHWYNPEAIGRIMRHESYKDFVRELESRLHNTVHPRMGGDFLALTAANDPLCFLHHAQLDHIWWRWQQQKPTVRLMAYEGRHMFNSTDENASLQDMLLFGGFVEDVPVWRAMDSHSEELCYTY